MMTVKQQRKRGKFGLRSPLSYGTACPRNAVIRVLYDTGAVVPYCKAHTPQNGATID